MNRGLYCYYNVWDGGYYSVWYGNVMMWCGVLMKFRKEINNERINNVGDSWFVFISFLRGFF